MKKVSRPLCLVISIFMLLSLLLTGCSGGGQGDSSTASEASTVADSGTKVDKAAETELAPYLVKWYIPSSGTGAEPDEKLIEEEMNKYLKDKINTTVDINLINLGDFNTTIRTIIQSGEKVDLFFSCSWGVADYIEMARDGWVVELTDEMLDKYAPHAKEVLSSTPYLEGAKVNGKLYHLPCNKELGFSAGMLFNKALIDKYNIDLSTVNKYSDLYPILQMIKEKEPDVYPLDTCRASNPSQFITSLGNTASSVFVNIVYPMNGTKWINIFDVPEAVEIFKTAAMYNKAGFVRKDAATVNDIMPDMKAGKIFAAHYQLKPGKDKEVSGLTPGVEWVQKVLSDYVVKTGDTTGSMMTIPTTCEDPARVLMFYDYFYYDKNMLTLVNYGIENKHYVKADENTVDYAPATENGTKTGWKPPFTSWTVGDQFQNYILKGEDADKYANLKAFNAMCKPFGDSTGFMFDNTNCRNLYEKLYAASGTDWTLLNLGVVDDVDATIAKQLKIWNDAGLQEMLAEYNKQFEAWKAKQ